MPAKQIDKNLEQLLKDNNYFVVSKKSITWGISILGFLLISLWGILQNGISNSNKKSDITNESLTKIINALDKEKVTPLEHNVNEMKGDVKVLLDRTNSRMERLINTNESPNNTVLPPTN